MIHIAHADKYHAGAIGHLFKHYERAKDESGNYIKFKNQNIDLSKTGGNYNLATFQPLPQLQFIRKRLSEVKVFKRTDVKVMCDWVVTLPKGMEPDERLFFWSTVKFLSDRYGQKNIISAYVHRDETQPHLHFAFVPITTDKKKNIQKVSAKEVLTRNELQKFHGDLDAHLTAVFGRSIGVLNDATRDGNKSIDELKRGTAVKELAEKKAELKAVEDRIGKLKWPYPIKPIKEKSDTVVISKSDFQSANDVLSKKELLESKAQDADKILKADYRMENFRLGVDLMKLRADNSALITEVKNLKIKLDRVYNTFGQSPALWEEFIRLAQQLEHANEEEFLAERKAKQLLRQMENEQAGL